MACMMRLPCLGAYLLFTAGIQTGYYSNVEIKFEYDEWTMKRPPVRRSTDPRCRLDDWVQRL